MLPETRCDCSDRPVSFLPLPQTQFHVLVALTEGERHGPDSPDMNSHSVYRALTVLYSRKFCDRYRDDLIQHHADLAGRRGRPR